MSYKTLCVTSKLKSDWWQTSEETLPNEKKHKNCKTFYFDTEFQYEGCSPRGEFLQSYFFKFFTCRVGAVDKSGNLFAMEARISVFEDLTCEIIMAHRGQEKYPKEIWGKMMQTAANSLPNVFSEPIRLMALKPIEIFFISPY